MNLLTRLAVVTAVISATLLAHLPSAQAAGGKLTFSPSSLSVTVGKTFTVNVNLEAGQAINSAGGTVVFPGSTLQAVSVSQSGSIFTLWTTSPTISGETISFGGGLASPGYSGTGKIFSISFKAKSAGTAGLSITGGQTLANDGKGTDVYAGANTAVITISETYDGAAISSPTHPKQTTWYKERDLTVVWTKPSKAKSYSYSLNKQGGSVLKSGSAEANTLQFSALEDGIWVFHLTTNFGATSLESTYKAQIDGKAPNPFTVKVAQNGGNTDPFPVLSYEATDETSGVERYEIIVDNGEVLKTSETSYKLPRQSPGAHIFVVRAIDRAGNVTEAAGQFEVAGFKGPTITGFPKFVSVLQPITFKGRALYNATVHLFADGKPVAQFVVKDNLTPEQKFSLGSTAPADGQEVEWTYTYQGTLWPGKHLFYATQVKPDTSESNRSNEVTIKVLASSVAIGTLIVPMMLIVVALGLLLIVLLITLFWLYRKLRRAIRDWRDRLTSLQHKVDKELEEMEDEVEEDVDNTLEKPKELRQDIHREIEEAKEDIDQDFQTAEDKKPGNHPDGQPKTP